MVVLLRPCDKTHIKRRINVSCFVHRQHIDMKVLTEDLPFSARQGEQLFCCVKDTRLGKVVDGYIDVIITKSEVPTAVMTEDKVDNTDFLDKIFLSDFFRQRYDEIKNNKHSDGLDYRKKELKYLCKKLGVEL